MKYILIGMIAANVFVADQAFAKNQFGGRHECVKYIGNWVNAPKISCADLMLGNSVDIIAKNDVKPITVPPVTKPPKDDE